MEPQHCFPIRKGQRALEIHRHYTEAPALHPSLTWRESSHGKEGMHEALWYESFYFDGGITTQSNIFIEISACLQ
ncbi:hypothetical protein EYC84_003639 [Monilinia fructicola]|uniref:Uncharacterized protein n=1 Tax=Monilinia fructicola TaxID=38448 RepID=A0A5M9JWV5_MONFR|nr:hypothetical protein EYC84_003639 [Monilinia fructicola]